MFIDIFEQLCKQKGVSASKACDEMGFSRSTITNWRNQSKKGVEVAPDTTTLKKIADYFEIPTAVLLGMIDGVPENGTSIKFKDDTPSLFDCPTFSEKELMLIEAYRQNPEMQQIVDLLLAKFADNNK